MSDGPLNRQQIQERLLDSPFNAFLALEVVTADPTKAEVVMRLKMRPQFERLAGTFFHAPQLVVKLGPIVFDDPLFELVGIAGQT